MHDTPSIFGLPLQEWSQMLMGAGAILSIIGIWLRLRIVEVRIQAEEDIKNRKISADGAELQVKRQTLLINCTLLLGVIFVCLAIMALILRADIASDGPLR